GRTGRGEKGGKVLIQTFAPEHFIYRYLAGHDYKGFAEEELGMRKALGYPPAGRLMLFTVSARARELAEAAAAKIAGALERSLEPANAVVLGPTPALVERMRGRHRFQLLVRGTFEPEARSAMVRSARESLAGAKQVDLQWDVDPIELS
ncbi:MAG: primosomal protein N', partial [Candidatus Krumholzibacteriia bacterium]